MLAISKKEHESVFVSVPWGSDKALTERTPQNTSSDCVFLNVQVMCSFLWDKIVIMLRPRYIQEIFEQDPAEEMVLQTAPRQVGRSTLARTFFQRP